MSALTSQVYLCSPETAAVSTLTGELTDPRGSEIPYAVIQMPAQLPVDAGHFVYPPKDPETVRYLTKPGEHDLRFP